MAESSSCRVCQFEGCDVRLVGCGCTLHARCVPVCLVASFGPGTAPPQPIAPNTLVCPFCQTSAVTGIHLMALGLEELDQAVEMRMNGKAKPKSSGSTAAAGGEQTDPNFLLIETESSYLNLAPTSSNALSATLADSESQRTGRWTTEEIAYVDFLLNAFDNGTLPLAQGLRLNDFLGEILMCKRSRLTKKMKNARLSTRSYELSAPAEGRMLDCEMLSSLLEKFLQSIANEATRCELRFNTTKAWRCHFSNFLLQLGSSLLDASDWISSVEVMERRAAQAEETIRKARRHRMGLALKADVRTAQSGVFFSGFPVQRTASKKKSQEEPATLYKSVHDSEKSRDRTESVHSVTCSDDASEAEFISNMLDATTALNHMEDLSMQMINDFFENTEKTTSNLRNNCGPFLEEIVNYMEVNDLPVQHVDVWVPSYMNDGNPEELRLFHAGHATRNDIDAALFCQLHEYGEYSTKFSFAPGVGLPGRVYATDKPSWECRIDNADPKLFVRAGGAKVYGIKTGFGFPLRTHVIGRMVVSMYSTSDFSEMPDMVEKIVADLRAYCPEPKWKLVVEMGFAGEKEASVAVAPPRAQVAGGIAHYNHGSPVSRSSPTTSLPSFDLNSQSLSVAPPLSEEQRIATLLGNHMPVSSLPNADQPVSSSDLALLPEFMSLRLLLLRAAARRTPEEADQVDIIVQSYRGYSQDKRRSEKDLAMLLVQDWKYLRAPPQKPAAVPRDAHQCHVMDAPLVSTYAPSGGPTRMPSALTYVDPSLASHLGSFDDLLVVGSGHAAKKRRVSVSESLERFKSEQSVNIVDGSDEN